MLDFPHTVKHHSLPLKQQSVREGRAPNEEKQKYKIHRDQTLIDRMERTRGGGGDTR